MSRSNSDITRSILASSTSGMVSPSGSASGPDPAAGSGAPFSMAKELNCLTSFS